MNNKNVKVAVLSKVLPFLGGTITLIFLMLAISRLVVHDYRSAVVMAGIAFVDMLMVVAYVNCRIWYAEDSFTVRNIFGITRTYLYSDITGQRTTEDKSYLYINNTKITLSTYSQTLFFDFARQKYRELNRKNIPEMKNYRKDIFNGNVENAGERILLYVLVSIIAIGAAVYGIMDFSDDAEWVSENVIFEDYEVVDSLLSDTADEIILFSSKNMDYEIEYVPDGFKFDNLEDICNGQTPVSVLGVHILYSSFSHHEYISVREISRGNKVFLSKTDTDVLAQQSSSKAVVFVELMVVLWFLYVVLSIFIGRNPEKHPLLTMICFPEKRNFGRSLFKGKCRRKKHKHKIKKK